MLDLVLAADLLVATLVGMAVGIEREWSGHSAGPDARFAGVRTFALLGAIGGFAGWFYRIGQPVLATVLMAGGVLFPVVAFFTAMRRPGTSSDSTTEVVAMLVVALGATAGLGNRTIASAAAAVVLVLLAEKSKLQRALEKVDATEMRAALQFAVLALVVLPLLPDRAIGPYGAFQPRSLWIVVLLFSALNFAGYIARRAIGETRGLGVTGLLGGLVSSTAVTLTFSRRSRDDTTLAEPLALGVVAACTVLVPRVLIVSSMLQPAVGLAALPVLAPAFVAGATVVATVLWRDRRAPVGVASRPDGVATALGQSPLGLASALQMAVAFQLVLFIIAWVQGNAGNTGVLASATLLGLTDVDALTVSMSRYGADPTRLAVAATAMGIGVLSNTALKLALVLTIGASSFRRRAAAGLLVLAAGSAVGLWIGWP